MITETIRKYWRVHRAFINNSISYEAQYRQDTILKLFINLLWVGLMFLTIEVVFSHTKAILGWTKIELYLMTVFWIIADDLFVLFFCNVFEIPNLVTDGNLDPYLTKPLPSLYLVTCNMVLVRSVYRIITQILILIFLLYTFNIHFSALSWLLSLVLLICAVIINYSFFLIANTFCFWFMRIENINEALGVISNFGKYPISIWPKTIKILFLTFLPVAFSGFIPVAALSGKLALNFIIYTLFFATLLLTTAISFWNYAVKRYSSASS